MCNSSLHRIESENWDLLQSFSSLGQRIAMFEVLIREHKLNPSEVAALVPVAMQQLDGGTDCVFMRWYSTGELHLCNLVS